MKWYTNQAVAERGGQQEQYMILENWTVDKKKLNPSQKTMRILKEINEPK